MPSKTTMIIVGLVAILSVILAYLVLADPLSMLKGKIRRNTRLPQRKQGSTMQVLEKHQSSGLAWSRATYPEQFSKENATSSEFVGLDDFTNERFLDIAGRAYSKKFLENFSYTEKGKTPKVRVDYLQKAESFTGEIIGSGLKPNFAYQIKLFGLWSDREAFENIGKTGRWRLPGRGTNYTDKDYEEYPDKHLVEAYMLFDYAVTDAKGNLSKKFYVDSSLHVLWNYSTQRSPKPADVSAVPISRKGSSPEIYANPNVELSDQNLFAESQQNFRKANIRDKVGQAFLPVGTYSAQVILTEESFHGFGDAGFWATVMAANVEFEIEEKATPPDASYAISMPTDIDLSLLGAKVSDIDLESLTATELLGIAEDRNAYVTLASPVTLPAGERYLLVAEVLTAKANAWRIYAYEGELPILRKPSYITRSYGKKGWHRFEIEVTSATAGRTFNLALSPTASRGPLGIRNISIQRIVEPESPALKN